MRPLVLIGIVLVVVGLAGLVYGGISYTKSRESVDLGIAELQVENRERLDIHPAIGAVVLIAGIAVTMAGMKKS